MPVALEARPRIPMMEKSARKSACVKRVRRVISERAAGSRTLALAKLRTEKSKKVRLHETVKKEGLALLLPVRVPIH